ncbi:MAG: tetratricopeptide repeat protein, partial [Muribaculaceae bacterium]|nr:tetratricopeptide repeat protein [Muribaculaceae bacterium]
PQPRPVEKTNPAEPQKAPAGSLLSESLAKIFIKQHNYQGAYEIISSLNLNYPEKSIYFADQLRFLRKLIINSEAQKQQNVTANKK